MRRELGIVVLLVAATLAVYRQVGSLDFVNYDDPDYVSGNATVRAGLTREGVAWAFTTGHAGNWHPLTWLSHMLDVRLHGLSPGGHHVTNVVLHTANVLLLFAFLAGTTGAAWPSAAVAALFALHPLHVESVAWVSERKDVLSTFFWMLTLLAYWWYARRRSVARYLAVLVLLACGLMAKPMVVTLPLVMLLVDVWPLRRALTMRDRLVEKLPFLALAVASAVMTFTVQLHGGAVAGVDSISFGARVANALVAYVAYLGKMVYPANLIIFYPHVALPRWQVVAATVFLIGASWLVLHAAPRRPWLVVGWLWYLVTLLPVIGIVQVGDQAIADRFTYVPLVGPFMMLAWGAAEFARAGSSRRWVTVASAVLLLAGCAVASARQLRFWRDSVVLFDHAVAVTPESWVAQVSLANALAERGRLDEAIVHYAAALRVKPELAKAHANLGVMLARKGRLDEAVAQYVEALRLNPDLVEAHNNLGAALAGAGRTDEAIAQYEYALLLRPDYADAHANLGMALTSQGKMDLAIAHYSEALRLDPDHPGARENLARALAARGR